MFATLVVAAPWLAAADGALSIRPAATASYILVGFAGGFVRHDDPHHGPVQLALRIQPGLPKDASIQVFPKMLRSGSSRTVTGKRHIKTSCACSTPITTAS